MTEHLENGPMTKADLPIVVEAFFDQSPDILWNALTKLEKMNKWYFEAIPAFQARKGFRTSFKVNSEDRTFTHQWEVLEVIPGTKITYQWMFKEYPGASTSTFEVMEKNGGSKLKLTIVVQEDFPKDAPEFKRESCIGGWDYLIHGNLKKFMDLQS